ncbi:unnamed protein product [Closterium sp. NIES-54]
MVQQVLQRFDFTYSSPQATPLSTRHSLSALPSDESVEPSGPYPELVGCIMYLMTCTRPDLAYPLSILARYVAPGRHRPEHMAAAKRVLRYLCSTSGMGLVLRGRRPVVLTGHANASWADDLATQRSSQGYTFSLGSGSVSWRSTCSSSVLSSSCEAEIYAGAMAAQELRWLTYLLTDLGEQPRSPPVLRAAPPSRAALPTEPRCPTAPHCPACTAPAATAATATTTTTTTTATTAATAAMGSPTVLTFDAEGRAVDFDVWVDDLQLFLQCDSRDGVSLFYHTSGVSTAPATTADSTVCLQWTTRDAVARLAVRSHLPPAERAHFGQYKTAKSLYDAVVARYSSPAIAALSRLMLPYLFPDLAAFATVADLITHLRTSDARYRAALPTELCGDFVIHPELALLFLTSLKPPAELVLKWIDEAWADVPKEMVRKAFLTCGISKAEDRSKDHLILAHMRDSGEVEVLEDVMEEEQDELVPNPFYPAPMVTPPDVTVEMEEEAVLADEAEEADEEAVPAKSDSSESHDGSANEADEWSDEGDEWWAPGRYKGAEVEEWVAGYEDE